MKCIKILVVFFVVFNLISCSYDNKSDCLQSPTKQVKSSESILDPALYASQHSEALDFFLSKASSDNKHSCFNQVIDLDQKSDSTYITKSYISSTLASFNFYDFPTEYEEVEVNKLKSYIDEIYPIVTSDLSSYSTLCKNVRKYMDAAKFNKIEPEYRFLINVSLLILIDSYNYWIENDGLYNWVHTIYTEQDREYIYKVMNVPNEFCPTKSPGDMMIWRDIARRDAENGGFVGNILYSDVTGFITSMFYLFNPIGGVISYTSSSILAAIGALI